MQENEKRRRKINNNEILLKYIIKKCYKKSSTFIVLIFQLTDLCHLIIFDHEIFSAQLFRIFKKEKLKL